MTWACALHPTLMDFQDAEPMLRNLSAMKQQTWMSKVGKAISL